MKTKTEIEERIIEIKDFKHYTKELFYSADCGEMSYEPFLLILDALIDELNWVIDNEN